VKPSHILFRDHQPVLIDLGAAGFIADDPLAESEIVGSPAWMAPEQIDGARPAPEADVWSLSALGLALVLGKPLFRGSAAGVLEQRRRTDASAMLPLACFSDYPQLLKLMRAGLDVPERRPSAAEIADALAPAGMQAQHPLLTQRSQSVWAGPDERRMKRHPFQSGHFGDHSGEVENTQFRSAEDKGT